MRYGPLPPTRLPQQDNTKLILMAERWSRSSQAQAKWSDQAKTAVDYVEGRQWTAEGLAAMAKAGRPALTFNMVAPLIRLISGYQRNNKTDIIYRPGNDARSTEDVATILTQTEKSIAQMNAQQFTDCEVFLDGIICGRGWFRNVLDFESNDFGEIKCRAVDPFTVYIDPDADTYDLNESASYMQISKMVSIDQVEACFGKLVSEQLRPFVNGRTPLSPVMSYAANEEQTPIRFFGARDEAMTDWWDHFYATMGEFVDTARKSIRIIETEHHVYEDRAVMVDLETGDRKVLPDNFGPERIQKMAYWANQVGNPVRVEKRRVRRIQNTVICGDMILYDAPSFYSTYSLTGYFPYFRRGITRGAVEDLIDPQNEKNKRRSVEIEMVSKLSNGGWKIHKDSMTPQQKRNLRNYGSAPGFIMEWEGEKEPEQITPGAPPVAHERLEQKADQDMMKISGINESAMGQIDKVQSGRAIESRQRQAVVALQMYFDNFSRSKQLLGAKRLEIIQEHYTEQRLFRILGEDGKMVTRIINERQRVMDPATGQPVVSPITNNPVERVLNDVTLGKYVSTVDETPMSANFLNAQFEEMLTMLEKMGPAMAPYIPAFADLMMDQSTLPRKDEWKERLMSVAPKILGFDPMLKGIPVLDPRTGQVLMDPATGQPVLVDPQTMQPVQQGQPMPPAPGAVPPPPGGVPSAQGAGPVPTNAPQLTQGTTPGGQPAA